MRTHDATACYTDLAQKRFRSSTEGHPGADLAFSGVELQAVVGKNRISLRHRVDEEG